MITVASPYVLGTAVLGAAITCVLHLLSVRRPPTLVLPTMRFLPDRPVRAVSRSARPSDLLLLILRVCALLLAGIAMSGFSWNSAAIKRGRVVVIDRTGTSNDAAELRARAADVLRLRAGAVPTANAGDASVREFIATRIVIADSSSQVMSVAAMRSFKPETLSVVRVSPNLSSALLASVRAAALMIRDESSIDSVELDVVSPLRKAGDDGSLRAVRAAWPGSIVITEVTGDSARIDSNFAKPAVQLAGSPANAAVVSAVGSPTQSGARGNGGVGQIISIEWPSTGVPSGWRATTPDTIGAIVTSGTALVWPFIRSARVPDSLARQSRPIAWWSDGAVAALEVANGNGCLRQVGARFSPSSDALQGQSARALIAALTAPCGARILAAPMSADDRKLLAGAGGAAAAAAFHSNNENQTPFGSVMLLLALVLLALEWWMRDRDTTATRLRVGDDAPLRKVA